MRLRWCMRDHRILFLRSVSVRMTSFVELVCWVFNLSYWRRRELWSFRVFLPEGMGCVDWAYLVTFSFLNCCLWWRLVIYRIVFVSKCKFVLSLAASFAVSGHAKLTIIECSQSTINRGSIVWWHLQRVAIRISHGNLIQFHHFNTSVLS